ncbi:DUF2326 domain-containing protein [Pectobacterium odoriferum]|uniref:DUF2326 domain-containing protein n=1 Tax=Pectobacterium odoriferum TaxID=78398 RepID=UPI000CD20098|nr:DUF2326 domain-containing protein [Pectobacterium odoriferum]POE20794.1 DUF2326 domain-containing protein [Pectobacterium odoriferum]
MFLSNLIVSSPLLGEIRNITFKKGVNLIVDKSTLTDSETGNSVGKTTALRSLDFCFGCKQDLFYTDPEFKKDNEIIRNFLIDNEVEFTLTLLSGNNSPLIIYRKALPEPKILCKINNVEYKSLKNFYQDLKVALFFSSAEKPTLRQIMTRVIRDTPDKMSNTLKTLFNKSNYSEYETLNLFLFGFEDALLLSEKQSVAKSLKKLDAEFKVLTKLKSKNALEQSLEVINNEIENSANNIDNYDLGASYDQQMQELNDIKIEISTLSLDLASMNLKRSLNEQAINSLLVQQDNSNPDDLKKLYNEATERVGVLNKTFEDALNFYNQMIIKKVEFIKSQMASLESEIVSKNNKLGIWLKKESEILKELSKLGSLSDLQLLQKDINKLYESKGSFESSLNQIEEYESKVNFLTIKLKNISFKIDNYISQFDGNLKIFNKYFSKYTRQLYNEEFILSYEYKSDLFQFTIDPIGNIQSQGNLGDGKKKAQVSAFDLAYLSLQEEISSRFIRFVAHDGIEAIHQNQIKALFDIAATIDGQYIIAILKDKLASIDGKTIATSTILELSENDKFFKC